MIFRALLAAAFLMSGGAVFADALIGGKVDTFTVKDIRYLPRTLSDFGEQNVHVFVFYTNDCPQIPAYIELLKAVDEEHLDEGVQVVLVNVGKNDTIMDAALFVMLNEIPFPVVKDMDGECSKALGITHYPSVAVLDKTHMLKYRGKVAESDSADDTLLRKVIAAVLAGQNPETPETEMKGCAVPSFEPPALDYPVNYAEHIAPIMQEHCVACHRPNGVGPASFTNYNRVAGNAEMIKEVVWEERMPPWYAHPEFGDFENNRRLSDDEKLRIVHWVRTGMEEGDTTLLSQTNDVSESQWLTSPDVIIPSKQQVALPATGFVPYQYLSFDYDFTEDTYVQAIEIMPENPRVVHHANAFFTQGAFEFDIGENFLTGKVPGSQPSETKYGIAWMIPKGSVLRIQVHYVTTGKPEKDRINIGLRFAKEPINKRLYYKAMMDHGKINIPPHARAWKFADSKALEYDVTGIGLFGHLHLRGKHFKIHATYPDSATETLFAMPNYNFGWQMTYHYPYGAKKFPKGTVVESVAWYDNSAFNPYNPAPEATVKTGPQTVDEMMNGFFVFTRDDEHLELIIDPATGHVVKTLASNN